jgi:uncharacterized membrane protein
MSRKTVHFQRSFLVSTILFILPVAILSLVFVGVVSVSLANVGFTSVAILLILIVTFLGSSINIPLLKLETTLPIIKDKHGMTLNEYLEVCTINFLSFVC